MALSKEEKRQIKQAYEREWRNYRARLRRAESQGYVIPDRLNLPKVKNPQSWATVDKLKAITNRVIKNAIRFEGGQLYVDKYGTVTPKKEAVAELDIQATPLPKPLVRRKTVFETDPNRPLSFDEYRKLSEEAAKIRPNFDLDNPVSKTAFQDIVLSKVATERGKGFDESTFLFNEERKGGYLARDPNRPLEQQEINLIKAQLEHNDVDIDDPFMYQKAIDNLRSIYPDYEREIQIHQEEMQDEPAFIGIIDDTPEKDLTDHTQDWAYDKLTQQNDMPDIEPKKRRTLSSQTQETYAYNTLYSMISETILGSKFAQRNRQFLLNELSRLANSYDPRPLNNAVKALAGDSGELFDVELLYKTGELAQWIFRLERLIIQLASEDGEASDEQLDEAEANLSEALENIDEFDSD